MTYYYIQLIINGIALGSVYSLIALGFTLIFSVLKFSNFSHGGVMVVSAYFAYIVCKSWNLGFVPMILITVLFGGCLSCLVQFIGFERLRRTKGSSMLFFVSSANLGTLLQNIIILMFASSYYSYPSFFSRSFFQINENLTIAVTDMIMLGLSAVGILVLMYILYKTRMGISIRALSMDSDTAKLMGINVSFVMALTFFISGMLAAIVRHEVPAVSPAEGSGHEGYDRFHPGRPGQHQRRPLRRTSAGPAGSVHDQLCGLQLTACLYLPVCHYLPDFPSSGHQRQIREGKSVRRTKR